MILVKDGYGTVYAGQDAVWGATVAECEGRALCPFQAARARLKGQGLQPSTSENVGREDRTK